MNAFENKVIGCKNNVNELLRVADILKNKERYERLGATTPKNILLMGEAGLGKSLCAHCFIEEVGQTSFVLRREKSDGDFIKEITETFDKAIANQPSIVLLDDMDHYQATDFDSEVFTVIQAMIDKVKDTSVFIIATVNDTDTLPKSLKRSGRFDIKLNFDELHGKELEDIISHYLKNKHLADDVDFTDICHMLGGGASCADIEKYLNHAALIAGYEKSDEIHMNHFVSAILQNRFHYYKSDEEIDEEQRITVAVHEAAHVLVAEILQPNSVGFASLLIRENFGGGCNGVTHYFEPIKRRAHKIMTDLAGKVATELSFPKVASGCISDLSSAGRVLTKGISDNAIFGLSFLDVSGVNAHEPSEDYLRRVDSVVAAELERYLIVKKLGIPEIRFHDLRHTYASDCIYAGDSIKTLQSNMGHATAAFTLDVYGHILEEMRVRSSEHAESVIQSLIS